MFFFSHFIIENGIASVELLNEVPCSEELQLNASYFSNKDCLFFHLNKSHTLWVIFSTRKNKMCRMPLRAQIKTDTFTNLTSVSLSPSLSLSGPFSVGQQAADDEERGHPDTQPQDVQQVQAKQAGVRRL